MRIFGLACLLFLTLFVSGCGNVFVRASWTGGTQTVSGVVSHCAIYGVDGWHWLHASHSGYAHEWEREFHPIVLRRSENAVSL